MAILKKDKGKRIKDKFRILFLSFILYPLSFGIASAQLIRSEMIEPEVLDGTVYSCTSATGNDTYACTPPVASPGAYVTNAHYRVKADVANTGAASVNFWGLGAKTIKKFVSGSKTDLVTGDVGAGQPVDLVYDGTDMIATSLGAGSGGGQTADNDLGAIAAFTGTGFATRTGTDTWAQRQITGQAGNIAVTNPAGIAGDVLIDLGASAVQTDQSNTWTTFSDQNMAAAASFTFPTATGAAPTLSGRCAYDSTAHRLKCGFNGTTVTLATTAETGLNTNLTQIGAVSPVANSALIYTGSTWGVFTRPSCSGANQAINFDATLHTEGCVTIAPTGVSGTTGRLAKFVSSTTIGDSIISESGTAATVAGNLTVGTGPFYAGFVPSGLTADRNLTIQNVDGLIIPCAAAGTFTNGHILVASVVAGVVTCADGGGAAGSGTWTDSSTNTGTNKTLVAVGAGGTNTITLPLVASFDGGAITASGGCQDPVKVQINSGPQEYAVLCATPASAQWGIKVPMLKGAIGTFIVRVEVNDSVSLSHVYAGTVKAQCRASGTAPSTSWGTTQTISITMPTASNTYQGASAAVTANGTCAADSDLYVQFDASGSMTDTGTARLIGVRIYQST